MFCSFESNFAVLVLPIDVNGFPMSTEDACDRLCRDTHAFLADRSRCALDVLLAKDDVHRAWKKGLQQAVLADDFEFSACLASFGLDWKAGCRVAQDKEPPRGDTWVAHWGL